MAFMLYRYAAWSDVSGDVLLIKTKKVIWTYLYQTRQKYVLLILNNVKT